MKKMLLNNEVGIRNLNKSCTEHCIASQSMFVKLDNHTLLGSSSQIFNVI